MRKCSWHCCVLIKYCFVSQAECLVETQSNVYERFLSGMMEKDKKQEEKSELLDADSEEEGSLGESLFVSYFTLS